MKSGGTKAGIKCFETLMEGWEYMSNWFAEKEKGHPTIESLNGWYCYNGNFVGGKCPNWTERVLKVKLGLENLK